MLSWFVVTTIFAGMLTLLACLGIRLCRPCAALQHALWLLILLKMMTPSCVAWPWSPWVWLAKAPAATQRELVLDVASTLRKPSMAEPMKPAPLDTGSQGALRKSAVRTARAPDAAIDPASVLEDHPPGAARAAPLLASGCSPLASKEPAGPIVAWGAQAPEGRTSLFTDFTVFDFFPAGTAPMLAALLAWPWKDMLISLWFAGAIAVLTRHVLRIASMERHCRRAALAPEWVAAHVAQIARRMRLKAPPVLVSEQARYPFLWCLGRPRLIWPAYLLNAGGLTPGHEAVLAHELAHLVRKDHLVAWLLLWAECLWWWNPLFYFVRTRLRDSAEQACDAWAVWTVPAARKSYAASLIDISAAISRERPFAPALGVFGARRHSFERRLTMIVQGRQRHRLGPLAAVALATTGMITLPGWSTGQEAERASATSSESSQQRDRAGTAAAGARFEFAQPAASAGSTSSGAGDLFPQTSASSAPAHVNPPVPAVPPAAPQSGRVPAPASSANPATAGAAARYVGSNIAGQPGAPPEVEVQAPIPVAAGSALPIGLTVAVSENALALSQPLTIRVFRLTHERAERMKPIVEHVLRAKSGEQGTQAIRQTTARPYQGSVPLRAIKVLQGELRLQGTAGVPPDLELVTTSMVPDGTRLVADRPRNALVARAPEATMAMIASIVQAFDVPAGQAIGEISALPGVQVLNFRTGTAQAWLEILSNLGLDIQVIWRDDEIGFAENFAGEHEYAVTRTGSDCPRGDCALNDARLDTTSGTQRGGSIIISGDPETLRQALYVVRELDNGEGNPAGSPR